MFILCRNDDLEYERWYVISGGLDREVLQAEADRLNKLRDEEIQREWESNPAYTARLDVKSDYKHYYVNKVPVWPQVDNIDR